MHKKQIIVALFAVSCIAVNPVIATAQPNAGLIDRAKKEMKEFKSAFSCVRKSGFHACTPAQKKRIAATATGVAALVVALALAGGGGFAAWKSPRPEGVGVQVVAEQAYVDTPLHQEAFFGDMSGVQPMLEQSSVADINRRGPGGATPLLLAAIKKKWDVVNALLRAGADPSIGDDRGVTPLHIAAFERQIATYEALMRYGAHKSVNTRDPRGRTPLHIAVQGRDLKMAQDLLKHQANSNIRDEEGSTPLHIAVKQENVGMVRALLGAGASLLVRDNRNFTPEMYALDLRDADRKAAIIELFRGK